MEYVGLLAPIAFVFALSALAQVGSLKKEVEKLKEELESQEIQITQERGGCELKKYEYKCVFIWGLGEPTTRKLNEFGREGWELVEVVWCWHYFKRDLEEQQQFSTFKLPQVL